MASSNDASLAASAAKLASAAASTALFNIALGITRGLGCGAFTMERGPDWGVAGLSVEDGEYCEVFAVCRVGVSVCTAVDSAPDASRECRKLGPTSPSSCSPLRLESPGDATPARAHAASTLRICSAERLGVTLRAEYGLFSLPSDGDGEDEPKATKRELSGVARLTRVEASKSPSGAPTTSVTLRDASSSPERRATPGDRREAFGDVRARIVRRT